MSIRWILLLVMLALGGCADFVAYKDAEFHHYSKDQERWGQ